MTLEVLAALDGAIKTATPAERAALVAQLSARIGALLVGLAVPPAPAIDTIDQNLTVRECAQRLGVSEVYIYRNARRLPFIVREGRKVLGNARLLGAYMARRRVA